MLHATKDTFATFFSISDIFVKQKIDSELLTAGMVLTLVLPLETIFRNIDVPICQHKPIF